MISYTKRYTVEEMRAEAAELYRQVTDAVMAGDRETARHRGYQAQRLDERADQMERWGMADGTVQGDDDLMADIEPSAIGIDIDDFVATVNRYDGYAENPCFICGRHVTPSRAKEAEFTHGGYRLVLSGEADPMHSGYMGLQVIGSDCHRRMMRWVRDHRG